MLPYSDDSCREENTEKIRCTLPSGLLPLKKLRTKGTEVRLWSPSHERGRCEIPAFAQPMLGGFREAPT